jgi:hypothetical protein
MMRNCNVQYTFLERRCNMHNEYDSKVGQYEHRGEPSQQQPSGGLFDKLKRSTSRKGKSQPVQTRIDTKPWTSKSKQAKSAIGKAWAKFFHTEAIPGVKADNPYFVVACKETQR